MVGPERKRQAVLHVRQELEVSERRACITIRQPRATQRYHGIKRGQDASLAGELRRISAAHPRAGYRRATALLRRAGLEINAKRVQRLWRQEGLKVPRRQRKRARLGSSENGTQRMSAERVNHVWSYDFVMDQTEDGRRLKWLPICDEFSRELVALEVERRMEAKDVIRILDQAVAARGCVPEFIRVAHLLEQRRGRRVVADVVEGLNFRVSFHVRLPGEDEDFERLRIRRVQWRERAERDDGE